jgi:uncharacterized protein YjbI with pentapeptide repeats
MILPHRAPVRPRVYSRSGEALPLEEEVEQLLTEQSSPCIIVHLSGPPGSGKTTALRHLAAVLPAEAPILLMDGDAHHGPPIAPGPDDALVCTFEMAPWGNDELIEYLLTVHKDRCASVMRRLCGGDHDLLGGIPDLWQIVLEQLAADPALPDARAALHRYLAGQLADTDLLTRARSACLNHLVAPPEYRLEAIASLARPGFEQALLRVLRHPAAQRMLAVERMTADLHNQDDCDFLARRLPPDLVQPVGRAIRTDDRAIDHLRRLLAGPTWSHAMAASLLFAADRSWKPAPPIPVLTGAYLDGAVWPELHLGEAQLGEADLRGAYLRRAVCDKACLSRAILRQALLVEASLEEGDLYGADLSGANLGGARAVRACFEAANLTNACCEDAILTGANFQGADLRGASFVGADLAGAILTGARIEGADFTGANLRGASLKELPLRLASCRGACFAGALMQGCDLEGMDLPGADFDSADLHGAYLTGAQLAGACFRNSMLSEAGLADVEWEGADLRWADLRGASFHLGSSRSGLVNSPIACEGSRTGFYTDDYEEQHFQPPEQIRKANLQGTDLRCAHVDDVDFYLVDLRGALYTDDQETHFRRCRAIL